MDAKNERNKVFYFIFFFVITFFQIPLEHRLKEFRELLEEKKVSASSTWEKELSKIVFDPRYLLLSSDERKAVKFIIMF